MTGPNETRLQEVMQDKVDNDGLRNMHISWGDGAADMSREERSGAVLEVLAAVSRWNSLPIEEKMRQQIKDVYFDLKEAIRFCQFDASTYLDGTMTKEDLRERLDQVFLCIDSATLLLGNWVSNEDRQKARDQARDVAAS